MQRLLAVFGLAALAVAVPAHAKEKEGSAAAAEAQPARRIGLRDALALAVRQNPTLANEAIDIGISDAKITESYGLDDWLIDAGASWTSQRFTPVEGQFLPTLARDNVVLNGGVTKPLTGGGSVGVRFTGAFSRNVIDVPAGFEDQIQPEQSIWAPSVQVTFFQPLMRGFGEKTRNAGRRVALLDKGVQELERENAASVVVRDVINAYWELAFSYEALQIQKQSLALAQEQLRITSALVEAGKLARTERLAVEQIIAQREEAVLLAEQLISDRSIELRRLVGMEIGPGEIDLTAADRLETAMHDPDLDAALKLALENNPQLRVIMQQEKVFALNVEITDNGLLPQLDLTAHAGPSGQDTSMGDAVVQMSTFDNYELGADVTFRMSKGNHAAEGRAAQAKGNLRKARLSEQDIRAQISAAIVRTVNLIKASKKRLETAMKGSKLATQNIDAERVRWEQGRSTNFDVLLRQDELAQSQLSEARAKADYLKYSAILEQLTGQILARYGIELAPAE